MSTKRKPSKSDVVVERNCPHCATPNYLHFLDGLDAVEAQTAYTHCSGCKQLVAVRMTRQQLLEVANERRTTA